MTTPRLSRDGRAMLDRVLDALCFGCRRDGGCLVGDQVWGFCGSRRLFEPKYDEPAQFTEAEIIAVMRSRIRQRRKVAKK
jgi:hypothetical protein